jgi:putative flavoprotein involved in K+ transport
MTESIETLIIGAGQAGLSLSYCLKQAGHEHIVLEQATQPGTAWLKRWDSFTFVTPNWAIRLPGAEYSGEAPDAFLPRAEILKLFAQYAQRYALPVRYGVKVTGLKPAEQGYQVETESAHWIARNVVVATGSFQKPKFPAYHAELPNQLQQLHSGEYSRPEALPPGAVLVVGSGQSGCQIAEELYQRGRKVYLSLGGAGRVPRR